MHQVVGKTAALLLHELPGLNTKRMSDEEFELFPDQAMLGGPPTFNIPPPPRPPWMASEAKDCMRQGDDTSLSEWLSQMQSCDSTLIRDSQNYFEDTFHSIAIIVVCSVVLVILILALGLYVFKRRKTLQPFTSDPRHLSGSMMIDHGSTMSTSTRPAPRFVGNVNPAIDCATPTHLSHTLGPMKPRQVLYEGQAVTSLMHNGLTMTRCLANHYIPDHQKMMTLDNSEVNHRQQVIADELRHRFGPFPDRRNVMELSERPPLPVPTGVYQMADYPHIVIGGKPFFLIPSSEASEAANTTSEAYAYPQHMPIYEEIDYNVIVDKNGANSACGVMDRPLSSATSHSNSNHTNTSELSSSGETSSSSSQKNMEEHNGHSLQFFQGQMTRNVRLGDGLERSRSPQSIYSARLVHKQQLPASSNSSVYYYSDTLRNTSSKNNCAYANEDTMNKVNTRVILEEDKKKGSTLV